MLMHVRIPAKSLIVHGKAFSQCFWVICGWTA
jgi:hypothetical protein